MEVLNYFDSDNQNHWLKKIKNCEWSAGQVLCELLDNGTFKSLIGENSKLCCL